MPRALTRAWRKEWWRRSSSTPLLASWQRRRRSGRLTGTRPPPTQHAGTALLVPGGAALTPANPNFKLEQHLEALNSLFPML